MKAASSASASASTAASRPASIQAAPLPREEVRENRASPEAIKALTDRLLALRRYGRPPFLVRNLSYVARDKEAARRLLWDLNWVSPHARTTPSDRHLILRVSPTQCVLSPGKTSQLLHPDQPLTRKLSRNEPYLPKKAKCRIWLSVKQEANSYLSFGLRTFDIRIWPKEHVDQGLQIDDFVLRQTFDVSSAIALIGTFPAALTFVVEVFSENPAAKPLNSYPARLRGEVCLLDRDVKDNTIVPNGNIRVPLFFAPLDACEKPSRSCSGFNPAMRLGGDNIFHGDRSQSSEDVIMVDNPIDLSDMGDADEITPAPKRPPGRNGHKTMKANKKDRAATDEAKSAKAKKVTTPDATIVLELEGTMQNAIKQLKSKEKPGVLITCVYESKELPHWDGVVRHDFVCPWCQRNCRRLQILLAHFQVDHDDMYFALNGVPNAAGNFGGGNRVSFALTFTVAVADATAEERRRRLEGRTDIREWDDMYANHGKYSSYLSVASQRESQDEIQAAAAIEKVRISDDVNNGNNSDSTDIDEDDKEFLDILTREVWNLCKVCQRRYDEPSPENTARGVFCSEFCETIYKSKVMEEKNDVRSSAEPLPNMLSLSSKPRPKLVNYKEKLGHLPLYHVVSVCDAKEGHFDDEDPDSEDEVDHSWRLDLSLERVRHLEGATPKEKLLYMMWNKFAHENYPVPSVYAERYSRFTLELFALEYGPQISQLQLRLQFVGFLRALHVHGLIDCLAIISIMLCLDGKKKRRDCKISSRPDVSDNSQVRVANLGKGGGAGRGRRVRRRN